MKQLTRSAELVIQIPLERRKEPDSLRIQQKTGLQPINMHEQ